MAVRLSALSTGCSLAPGRFLGLISIRDWVDPRVIGRLGRFRLNKKSGTEPATFRLVAWWLKQLRYRVTLIFDYYIWNMLRNTSTVCRKTTEFFNVKADGTGLLWLTDTDIAFPSCLLNDAVIIKFFSLWLDLKSPYLTFHWTRDFSPIKLRTEAMTYP
jgi:hypothetical protein